MKTSERGRRFIEAFEGKFLHCYDDGTGVLTIGYGHTNAAGPPKVFKGQCITEEEADAILSYDLLGVEKTVEATIPGLQQFQFDALVSFEFNTGCLRKSSIPAKFKAGDADGVSRTILQYDHAKGRQIAGLTRRRQAEKLMFEGNVDAALRLAGAHATGPDTPKMPQQAHAVSANYSMFQKLVGMFKR